ncbi:hypothetical protein [Chryseolinea lacunae]|uniref:Uncharacterized protein n=1 Tax=Chryseolinea lacunae TaxID=2801331 RepID=A0ABS1KN19_9BACT|nr:hypothetical protein [Chryseolinea lacunae]MBL0740738.1 hypothetical protein [Chryseolinea lacunae]
MTEIKSTGQLPAFLTDEVLDKLVRLLDTASADEIRETILELYHIYIMREHNALSINFSEMAHHVHLLTDFLKTIDRAMQAKLPPAGCGSKISG